MEWVIARLSEPASEPVTLAEAKAHLRVDNNADDTLITALIVEAREYAEDFCNRAFIEQTWHLSARCAPCGEVFIPRPPLIEISQVRYIDDTGAVQILDPGAFDIDDVREPGIIAPLYGTSWPPIRPGIQAFVVEYKAGYGVDSAAVPQGIKQGILQRVAANYEARGDAAVGMGAVATVGGGADATLQRFKVYWVA